MKTMTPDELCRNPSAMAALLASQSAARAAPAPAAPAPPDFPWPEIRSFIVTLITQKLVEQNYQIAGRMLEEKIEGASFEQVTELEQQVKQLDKTAVDLNARIEAKLRRAAPPNIILSR